MKKIRNFKCSECKKAFESMVKDEVLITYCDCGGLANRKLSAPKCFSNTVGKSPSTSPN